MVSNEFSHVVRLSEIGQGREVALEAEAAERDALARRFGLLSLKSLIAKLRVETVEGGARAAGRFQAVLEQSCVATGDPVATTLDDAIDIRFVPEPADGSDAEHELEADDCDTMFLDGQNIDLGEAVAQSLGLALDPYPRVADADERLRAAGVKSEEEAGPFGALAALKDKLARKTS
jgi:uncharacterized metal-binding protein YceD (DUF177 family)